MIGAGTGIITKQAYLMDQYHSWIGKTETSTDLISANPANGLAATLDREVCSFADGHPLPPLWQWLYFLPSARQSTLAADGHPRKGVFLPPIELPRRMWAGSRIKFHQPLPVGCSASKTSTIKSIQFKEGRSGKLAFVCVEHEITGEAGLAISEQQDIVYRDNPSANAPNPKPVKAPNEEDYSLTVEPDPVLLFRYSALTFNGHRIHYDRDYATQIEGYPGLIVHGPLLATYLLEMMARQYPNSTVTEFEFKAVSPVFDEGSFVVCGLEPDKNGRCELWIRNGAGELCVKGAAVLTAK